MSGAVKLVEKKRVLLESIDTGNGPNKTIDEIRKTEMGADLHKLKLIRKAHLNNPIIGYLNLNSLRNNIHEMREVFGDLSLDYFVLAETKINDEFPDSQFLLENSSVIREKGESQNGCFKKRKRAKFSEKRTVFTGKKCSFFGKFGVRCFLETFVLRFALLPYYRRIMKFLIGEIENSVI